MFCIVTQHFSLNRILLLAIGLWPYQQSKLVQLQIILSFGILISFIIFQLTTFVTANCTIDFVIKISSCTSVFIIYIILYSSFWINTHNVTHLLEQLQHICNEIKDENEIAIMKKYGNNAKRYTAIIIKTAEAQLYSLVLLVSKPKERNSGSLIAKHLSSFDEMLRYMSAYYRCRYLTSTAMCSLFIIILLPIWPWIFNIVLPLNESQLHHAMPIVTEYFVDQERYFYLIMIHTNAVLCIGVTTLIATGTMLMGYILHACGMFKIASYRIEQAMTNEIFRNISLENEIIIYKEIIHAVDMHRKTIRFIEFLLSCFEKTFFLLIVLTVVSLSLNLFGISRTISIGDEEEFLLHLLLAIGLLIYMFLGNYFGQEIIDHNNNVFSTAYNVRWYRAPLHTQRLILFILQRDSKAFNVNIGGMFVASLECFAMLLKASMSYFTIMYSTQQ